MREEGLGNGFDGERADAGSLVSWADRRRVWSQIMTRCSNPLRRPAALWAVGVCLAVALLPEQAQSAESVVPDPQQAYSEQAAVVVYVDAKGASDSTVGKTLAPLLKELPGQLGNLPGTEEWPIPSDEELSFLQSLEGVELSEIVLVMEGEGTQTGSSQLSEDDSLLLVTKLTQVMEDQEGLIGQLLALAEQRKPGLSNQVAQTRSREGAAEMFAVPAEALGDTPLPFPVSLAVGPGTGGSVVAFGRTDRLKGFLAGQSPGQLPIKVDQLLPSRGHIWVYASIPSEVAQAMGAGGSAGAEVPMMAGMSQSLEQLRQFGMNLNLGSSALGFELALGFASGQAAQEMKQSLDGMVGFMKMAASQSPSSSSGSLERLEVGSSGDVFRLSTSVTLAELRQGVQVARQQLGLGAGTGRAAEVGRTPQAAPRMPEVKPLEEKEPELELEFLGLLPEGQGHVRYGKLRVKNPASKAVTNFRLTYLYLDERGSKLGEWTRLQQDLTPVLVPAGATLELQVPMFNLPLRTEKVQTVLRRVEYTDGTEWP